MVVTQSWTQLTLPIELNVPISLDERGVEVSADTSLVWTAVTARGIFGASTTCANWTRGDMGEFGAGGNARSKEVTGGGVGWTAGDTVKCDRLGRVYCFEQ